MTVEAKIVIPFLEPELAASIDSEEFIAGNEYPVKVGLNGMEKGRIIDLEFAAFGAMELSDESEEGCSSSLDSDDEKPEMTFNIKAVRDGHGSLVIDSYYKNRFLGRLDFFFEVKPQSK